MTGTPSNSARTPLRIHWRAWAGRLGAILIGLLAAWLLLEVLLRVSVPLLPPTVQVLLQQVRTTPFGPPQGPLQRPDSTYGPITRPGANNEFMSFSSDVAIRVTTMNWLDPNSHVGFRVPSADWQPRWPVDAVIVGDSFSFCMTEYKDCWVQLLDTQDGLSVVNLGVPSTGSVSHQRVLGTFGMPYKPRIVIWQWWGNDFNDDYGLVYVPEAVGDMVVIVHPTKLKQGLDTQIGSWLARNSAVYTLADRLFFSHLYSHPAVTNLLEQPYQVNVGNLSLHFGNEYEHQAFDITLPRNSQGLDLTRHAILQARDELAKTNTPLIIVLIPSKEEVYQRWTEPQLGEAWLNTISAGHKQMIALCQANHLVCLDSTPVFTQHADQGEQLYWPTDAHLNPAGNKVLAAAVIDFLRQQGLVH